MVWKFSVIAGEGNCVVKPPFCIPLKLVLSLPETIKRYEFIGEDQIKNPPVIDFNPLDALKLKFLDKWRVELGEVLPLIISIGGTKTLPDPCIKGPVATLPKLL